MRPRLSFSPSYSRPLMLGFAAAGVLMSQSAWATVETLSANDAGGNSSFSGGPTYNWSPDATAPSAGNTYFTNADLLRSPTAAGTYTFGGDSLTVGGNGTTAAGRFLFKGAVTASANYILNGGLVDIAVGTNASVGTLAGTVNVTGASILGAFSSSSDKEILDVTATVSGSAALQINVAASTTYGGQSISATSEVGTVRLSGSNSYSGTITVLGALGSGASTTNGALQLNNLNAVQNTTVSLNTTTNTAPALTFLAASNTGTYNIGALATGTNNPGLVLKDTNNAAVAISVGGNNAASSFGGVISGVGSLTKVGTGTLTFSGANTYSGGTTVSMGMLTLTATGTLGTGNVTLADVSGVALTLGNSTAIADAATLTFGNASVINMNGTGSETLTSILDSTTGKTLNTPGIYAASDLDTYFGNINSFSGSETFTIAAVPEPSTFTSGLLLCGAGASLVLRRRYTNSQTGISRA